MNHQSLGCVQKEASDEALSPPEHAPQRPLMCSHIAEWIRKFLQSETSSTLKAKDHHNSHLEESYHCCGLALCLCFSHFLCINCYWIFLSICSTTAYCVGGRGSMGWNKWETVVEGGLRSLILASRSLDHEQIQLDLMKIWLLLQHLLLGNDSLQPLTKLQQSLREVPLSIKNLLMSNLSFYSSWINLCFFSSSPPHCFYSNLQPLLRAAAGENSNPWGLLLGPTYKVAGLWAMYTCSRTWALLFMLETKEGSDRPDVLEATYPLRLIP